MRDEFAGHGFVYWEEGESPDGRLRVLYGYSDGEKTPLLIEPRFVDAATGEVILDLWHTSHTYLLRFVRDGEIVLIVQNPYRGTERVANIDFSEKTFTWGDSPQALEPLASLRDRVGNI